MNRLLFAVILAAALGGISCGGGTSSAPAAPSPSPSPSATRIIGVSGNLAFGTVTVGQSVTAALTISNTGNGLLTWSGLSTGVSTVTPSATSGTVAAGASVIVFLTFTPTAAVAYTGTLTVTSDATSGTNTIAVSGTGTTAPTPPPSATRIIGLSGNLAFGNVTVGQSATATLSISNTGNSVLTWSGLITDASVLPAFSASATSGTVEPGGTATVVIRFSPPAAVVYSAKVRVMSDATGGNNSIELSGRGI